MGGIAVLNPQDLLSHNHHHPKLFSPAMKSLTRRNPNPCSGIPRSSNRRKRSPQKTAMSTPLKEMNTTKHATDLVMGQVRILKRGDALPSLPSPKDDDASKDKKKKKKEKKVKKVGAPVGRGLDEMVLLSSTDRLGPDPEVVPKHVRIPDFYAGSAVVTSPPPSSLPLPAFFKKKNVVLADDDCKSSICDATSDLIRLLRLDLS